MLKTAASLVKGSNLPFTNFQRDQKDTLNSIVFKFGYNVLHNPYDPRLQSRPLTSTTGTKSPRRNTRVHSRKQIRSTSHYTSRRNKYYRRQTYY